MGLKTTDHCSAACERREETLRVARTVNLRTAIDELAELSPKRTPGPRIRGR
jgi:hypothetical protein